MINTSSRVGTEDFQGSVTHTPGCFKCFMCTVFIGFCSIPLGSLQMFQKNTEATSIHTQNDMCLFQLALTLVTIVSTHLMIEHLSEQLQSSSCLRHAVAVVSEYY